MNNIGFKAAVAAAMGLVCMQAAQAHYLWIERTGSAATVFFGEYEELARERSPGRLDEIPGPRAQAFQGNEFKPVAVQKRADGFGLSLTGSAQTALVAEEAAIGVKDWRRAGIGIVKPYFYARHQGAAAPLLNAAPALTLDIVPQADAGSFGVYFKGKPLPKVDVKIVAPNTWAQEGRTGPDGRVQLPMPWRGQYVLQVVYLEPDSAGEFEGKPYQAKRHRATLTFVQASGEATFSPKADAKP